MTKSLLSLITLPSVTILSTTLAMQNDLRLMPVGIALFLALALIFFSGLCITAEYAIINLDSAEIDNLADNNHPSAQLVAQTLREPEALDQYIATAQVGITLSMLLLGVVGPFYWIRGLQNAFSQLLNQAPEAILVLALSYVLSLGLLTYIYVVMGQIIPKSVAIHSATQLAMLIAQPMRLVQIILFVPVRILNALGGLLLKVLRLPPVQREARIHSPEEIERIVSESAEYGLLEEAEELMIHRIFTFGDRQVAQIMTPRRKVEAIQVDAPLAEVLETVADSPHSRFPVYVNTLDQVIGILHVKDLVRQQLSPQNEFDLHALCHTAPTVPETYSVDKLLTAFKRKRIHMAIVIDEFGGTAGVVTLEDLVEEVVGEVRDEFDAELDPFIELEPGLIEVSGDFLLDDLSSYLEDFLLELDEDALPDVETVGGLITTLLGRPPEVGDHLAFTPFLSFSVTNIDGLAVARAQVHFEVETSATEDEAEKTS